jgi:photosystem II stability/assembly factor-like uncharacterized protein
MRLKLVGKYALSRINRLLSHLPPAVAIIILLQTPCLSQQRDADPRSLKRGGYWTEFSHSGKPHHFPSGMRVFERNQGAGSLNQELWRERRALERPVDTGMFQPVAGPYGGTVRWITLDSAGWLFIGTDGEVYRSKDNGQHWDMHLFPSQLHNYVEPVTVVGPNIVAAETDFSNFISTDRGDSWSYLYEDVRGLVVDTDGTVYGGSRYNGVKKSIDTARSWIPFALSGKKIWSVVLCGDGKLACPSDSGTYYSSDAGGSWTFREYETPFTWNLVSDKRGNLFVLRYYGSNFQLYRSNDFGQSWHRILLPVPGDAYDIHVENDGRLIVAADTHILMSTDAGENWNDQIFPIDMVLTSGRDASGALLVGCFEGIYRLGKPNGEWEEINRGVHARRIESIKFPTSGTMIVLSLGVLFRSTDDGNNWSNVTPGAPVMVPYYTPLLSTSSGNIFVAACFDNESECGLLRSTDDGISWGKISVLSNYYAITGLAEGASGDILAATSIGDIYRSTDAGNSWAKVVSSANHSAIQCIAADPAGNYYAASDSCVLVSKDAINWQKVPLLRNYFCWQSMNIDSYGNVYLGCCDGVFRSADFGTSWSLLNTGLFNRYVICTTTDDSGNVVLGTTSAVFRLADSADTWQWSGEGMPLTYTTSLSISRANFLFAGTQDFGMYKSDVPLGRRTPGIETPPPTSDFSDFALYQNYPNPFNPTTVIKYHLPVATDVKLLVYDILGRKVAVLVNERKNPGRYEATFDARGLSSGVYFYRLEAGSYVQTRKLVLLR